MEFKHLKYAKQTYCQHFQDSIMYSGKALKASWYFTVHSFLPDCYQKEGSSCIKELNEILQKKHQELEN
jgi:hypothetical protein